MRFSTAFVALVAPLLAVAAPLRVRQPSANDVLVLNFALVLERLETDFYTQALEKFQPQDFVDAGFSSPELVVEQFKGIQAHETAHIAALEGALAAVGQEPLTGCTFDFSTVLVDVATMAAVARVVENVGVSAYLGAASLIDDSNILTAAGSILTIEARHQTILNVLNGGGSVPQAFDVPLSPEQVLALAGGFISGCDLGVPANPALSITNTGAVSIGTKLEFSSTGIDAAGDRGNLTCQMLTGGAPFAISLPIDECVVPNDINGPVYIYIANTTQPLQSNLNNQFKQSIVAGPALAFIDSKPELIGQLAKTSDPVDSSRDLTPDEAAGAIPSSTEAAATATETAAATATESAAASATESAAASATESAAASSTTDAAAPATTSIDPAAPVGNQVPGSPQFEQLNQIVGPNTATGPSGFDNAVNVVGWSMVPASSI